MSDNTAIYKFKIGEFDAIAIGDGQATWLAFPTYAPNASETAVKRSLEANFLHPTLYTLNFNTLFVNTGRNQVLIDTGAGAMLGETLGKLANNLLAGGIRPQDIDTVVMTHGHPDHIGGLILSEGSFYFPNAEHFMAEVEYQFWTAETIDFGGMQIDNSFKQVFVTAAQTNLVPLGERVFLFQTDRERELVPGISALPAPGHTPGHVAVRISSGNAELLHVADTFHSQAFDLDNPSWATAFDRDSLQAYETRVRLLEQVIADRTLLMAYHMPFPGIGYVRKLNDRYNWVAAPWLFDQNCLDSKFYRVSSESAVGKPFAQ